MKPQPRSEKSHTTKRTLKLSALLAMFVAGVVTITTLTVPKPALAVLPVADAPLTSLVAGNAASDKIEHLLVESAVIAVVNGTNYFTQQLAYQAAKALTSDCPGQVACWDSKGFKDGFRQAWQGAIGESVGSLSQGLFGNNFLCDPGLSGLALQLSFMKEIVPSPPKCNFDQLIKNWDSIATSFSTGEILNKLKPQFSLGQSPLSVSIAALGIKQDIISNAQRDSVVERLANASSGGFSPIKDPVSGRIKSPGAVTQEEFRRSKNGEASQLDGTRMATTGSIAKGAVKSVVLTATNTFVSTLTARLWNKLVSGLLSTGELLSVQPDIILSPEGIVQQPGATASAVIQQSRIVPLTTHEAGEYDPLTNFTTCPPSNPAPNNCVMDQQFADIVRIGDATPLSVREALKRGMLHSDWRMFPATEKQRDTDPFCYTYAYCESNLKQLRAARIISIGWEIAASKVGATPVTLGEVVAHFNDCNANGTIDSAHPWCHLIDPDWVLKVPPTQCRATAFGPTLVTSETSSRAEVCVDSPTCLRQDDFGKCVGGWGYCQKERNVWRFQGEQCPAYYSSCRTLKTRTGGTENFLVNTIDVDVCNADNVGCLAYSLQTNAISAQKKNFCKAGANAGTQCTKDADCPGSVCVDTCPLEKGCLAGNASGNDGCVVANGKTLCKVDDGSVCTLEAKCASAGGCSCYLSTCRVAKGQDSCASTMGDDQNVADDWRVQPQRYFNKNAQTCSATDNGCSALVPLATGQSLNLVRNGGFEELEDGDGDGTPDHAKYWAPFGAVPASASSGVLTTTAANIKSGSSAMKIQGLTGSAPKSCTIAVCTNDAGCTCKDGDYTCKVIKGQTECAYTDRVIQDSVPVKGNTTYTLSATFLSGASSASGTMQMTFTDLNGNVIVLPAGAIISNTAYQDKNGNPVTPTSDFCKVDAPGVLRFAFTSNADEVRASCTLVVDDTKLPKKVVHGLLEIGGGDYVDEVQFEQGSLTPFHEGYGSANTMVDAKIPPAFLGCTGDETDRPECASFAGVCREQEVGCDRFTPTNGDPSLPAVTGPQDACPAQCAGYDIFKQEATEFDTEKFPVYFIPTTAKQCTQAESGCSEFTNVENEKVAYFSKLRLCQKPSTDPKTVFYSWEGSDTAGYQLKVWNFKKVTDAAGGDTTVAHEETCCAAGVCGACSMTEIGEGKAADECADPATCKNAGVAPCTRLDDNALNCASVSTDLPAGSTDGLCSRADIDSGDLDCREFYDADGNRHFRKLSKTIVLTAECHQYRITTATENDCKKSNGQWIADKGQCIYNADVTASQNCGKAYNGCRPYKGNASSNVRSIVRDTFEAGVDAWMSKDVKQSSESVIVGGHSLKFAPGSVTATKEVGGTVAAGRSYTLTFWARGSGTLDIGFEDGAEDVTCTNKTVCDQDAGCGCVSPTGLVCLVEKMKSDCVVAKKGTTAPDKPLSLHFSDADTTTSAPTLTLGADWKQYSLGPVSAVDPLWGTAPTSLVFAKSGVGEAYIDNVIVKEVPENLYVVRDSWNTPAACDQTLAGVPSPQEMLGCKEYTNSANKKAYLRSFAQLCRDKAVGCQAYSFTQNNVQTPYEESYNAVCQLVDKRATPEPRTCGKCTLAGGATCLGASCACNDGINSCIVAKGAKDCAVVADEASNCKCDYNVRHPWYTDNVPDIADICRVAIGENACQFKLDGWDDNTPQSSHPDRVNVSADDRRFLVARSENLCAATAIGCKSVANPQITYERECTLPNVGAGIVAGKCDDASGCTCGPIFNANCTVAKGLSTCTLSFENGVPGNWNVKALKDDPAQYGQTLCTQPAISCEEFTAIDGKYYFKEPFDRTCQYKEGVNISGTASYGWFRASAAGKDIPCYPELLQNGEFYNLYKNADALCQLPDGLTCGPTTIGWDASTSTCGCTNPPITTQVCRVARGNTTCGYQGWVGQCDPQYDRCEEFIDPAATSKVHPKGKPYYYIMNNKLDLTSCGGSASLKEGCVLFTKTSDPSRLFASAATYFLSEKTVNGGKVNPLNCNLDPRSPFCEGRCFSVDGGHTTACGADTDCDKRKEEKCDLSEKGVSPAGRDVTKNDANIVIKVGADRECAEWLTCRSTDAVSDEATGRYKYRCSGFDACDEQRTFGESQECSNWVERPEKVENVKRVTADLYAQRDITYKGVEYSGFTIPGQYPAQYALPVDFRMGRCADKKTGTLNDTLCWSDGTCNPPGSDPLSWGFRCGKKFVGFCESSLDSAQLKPCDTSAQCGSDGICNASISATQRVGAMLSTNNRQCRSDADCKLSLGCSGTYDCPAGSQAQGKCIANLCMYDMKGGPLRSDFINAPSCRGYPEDDAPFPPSVVVKYDNDTGLPKEIKSGFGNANICTKENACDCSYRKLGYGVNGTTVRYVSLHDPRLAPGIHGEDKGVCVGGPNDGKTCVPSARPVPTDAATDPCVSSEGGVCSRWTKDVTAKGWYGFCLDPDFGRFVNANPDRHTCNLWLPQDQLSGGSDLGNQNEEAGYVNSGNLLYCQVAQGTRVGTPGILSYSMKIEDQIGSIPADVPRLPGWGWWSNECYAAVGCKIGIGDLLGLDDGKVNAKWIPYPVHTTPPPKPNLYKFPQRDLFEDEIAGIHVFGNAGYFKSTVASGRKFDFYLTEKNQWTICIRYPNKSSGEPGPDNGQYFDESIKGNHEIIASTSCPFAGLGVNDSHTTDIDEPLADGGCMNLAVLGIRAHFVDRKLAGFATVSCNNEVHCAQLSEAFVGGVCTPPTPLAPNPFFNPTACIGAALLKAIEAIGSKDYCPNTLATVYVELRDWCQEIAFVNDVSRGLDSDFKNYAWTDRLANAYLDAPPYQKDHKSDRFSNAGTDIQQHNAVGVTQLPMIPYGAIAQPIEDFSPDPKNGRILFSLNPAAPDDEKINKVWNRILPVYDSEGGSVFTHVDVRPKKDKPNERQFIFNAGSTASGTPYACIGDCGSDKGKGAPDAGWRNAGFGARALGALHLSQYFAAAFNVYEWRQGSPLWNNPSDPSVTVPRGADYEPRWSYDAYRLANGDLAKVDVTARALGGDGGWDFRERYATEHNAPKVVAVDYSFCFGSRNCQEGPAGLTVNKIMAAVPVASHSGKLKATLTYYAYADRDHMPIRHKIVDWGDNLEILELTGWYKNRRGSINLGGGSSKKICDDPALGWGGGKQCQSEFFEETHTYTCSKEKLAKLIADKQECDKSKGIVTDCVNNAHTACVFKPRVQIMDNWQTCNGTCPGNGGLGNLCMNNTGAADECVQIPPDKTNPWTSFAGTIEVYPPLP